MFSYTMESYTIHRSFAGSWNRLVTALPGTPEERMEFSMGGVDVVTPAEHFSSGAWLRAAANWLDEIPASRPIVIVGGTGLYFSALLRGLDREWTNPPPEYPVLNQLLLNNFVHKLPVHVTRLHECPRMDFLKLVLLSNFSHDLVSFIPSNVFALDTYPHSESSLASTDIEALGQVGFE